MAVDERQHEASGALLERFAALLRASPHNLLSPRGLEELEDRHFPESLAVAAMLPTQARVLDVGSGGGLPGIVLAIARPDLEVHLLEATRKKVDFLRSVIEELGLGAVAHHGRAEDLKGPPLGGTFDVVTARAVAPLERLIPWCAPYLRHGGRLLAIKGERWAEELSGAALVMTSAGLRVIAVPEEARPEAPIGPRVVVLERTSTPRSDARKRGGPSRSPVGRKTKQ